MFGFITEALSLPVRLINVPVKIVAHVVEKATDPYDRTDLADRDPLCLDKVAEVIKDAGK